jgi:ankyrin repeat protein
LTDSHFARALQVEQLLDSGVNVNAQDAYGETALHLACMEGQYTVVRMLVVEQQARMDMRNWEGWVPMIWAIVRGHVEIVKFLAERVCSVTQLHACSYHSQLYAPDFTEGMCRAPAYSGKPTSIGRRCTLLQCLGTLTL